MSALKSQDVETIVEGNCIQLNNAIDLSKVNGLNKNFVIQDKQSQKVFSNLPVAKIKTVWDCCAASGGKSILLVDSLKEKIQLSISDIRKNILENAKERLATAGIPIYNADIIDLTKPLKEDGAPKYDLIICDVPCTGAGTWSRTPEQLYFFKKAHIANYADRQHRIANNVSQCLNNDGLLVYITCSVFEAENEAIVKSICQNNITLLSQQYYAGYTHQADSLFVAIMQKQ
jgi:16S rRNA (cytosine967-C5)-methyltransferase